MHEVYKAAANPEKNTFEIISAGEKGRLKLIDEEVKFYSKKGQYIKAQNQALKGIELCKKYYEHANQNKKKYSDYMSELEEKLITFNKYNNGFKKFIRESLQNVRVEIDKY